MEDQILGLRTTIYKVNDLDDARRWYSEVFSIMPYFDQPFYVGFDVGGFELGLIPDTNARSEETDNVIAYWGVTDIQSEYNRFLSYGAQSHEEPQDVGGGIITASVRDPWHNVIGLIYNPHFRIRAKRDD